MIVKCLTLKAPLVDVFSKLYISLNVIDLTSCILIVCILFTFRGYLKIAFRCDAFIIILNVLKKQAFIANKYVKIYK